MSLNGMDESHMSDMGATRANKFNGVPCDASQETSVRCVPLRERYYKCACRSHFHCYSSFITYFQLRVQSIKFFEMFYHVWSLQYLLNFSEHAP